MDREAKEEYHVVIQAKDMGGHMGGLSGTTRVTITLTDVNDNSAKFPKSKESKLSESLIFSFTPNLPSFQKEESGNPRIIFVILAKN